MGWYRKPKTFCDRRASCSIVDEFEPKFRAARNLHNLPTSWDDIKNSTRKIRSWKRFRKQQYK